MDLLVISMSDLYIMTDWFTDCPVMGKKDQATRPCSCSVAEPINVSKDPNLKRPL